jgi:MFS family permease
MFITSLLTGPLFDAGYLKSLLWTGTLLSLVGIFLTSICKEYWQFFMTQAVLMGLGFGLLYLPAPAVVSQYFHARTALSMGASSAGSAIGTVSPVPHRL